MDLRDAPPGPIAPEKNPDDKAGPDSDMEFHFRINDRVRVEQEGIDYHLVGTVVGWNVRRDIYVQLDSHLAIFSDKQLSVVGDESVDSLSCSNPYLISMAFSRPIKPKKSGVWPRGLNTKRVEC